MVYFSTHILTFTLILTLAHTPKPTHIYTGQSLVNLSCYKDMLSWYLGKRGNRSGDKGQRSMTVFYDFVYD